MTADPITFDHPVLGRLDWDAACGHWDGTAATPGGGAVRVFISPEDEDRVGFLKIAAELFLWATANERRILADAAEASLLELYNDGWRQEGEPVLTTDEFADRMAWTSVDIASSDFMPVELCYGDDDRMFGGHSVVVQLGPDLAYRDFTLFG